MLRWTPLVLLAALVSGCAATDALDPRTARFPPVVFEPPAPQQSNLTGGAKVFLLEDHDVPLVRLFLTFRGGSLYDPPSKAGLAQVAALSWRTGGTGELSPEAVDEALEHRAVQLSLSIGRSDGWVTLSLLPDDLGDGLDLLADLLIVPAFQADRVSWAVTQVAERIQREADDPQSLAFRELRRELYRNHPRGVVPTLETVHRVTRDDVLSLHRRILRDGAWVIGAVGDFERGTLLKELAARFGELPGAGEGFEPPSWPSEPEPRVVVVRKRLPQATIVWARLGFSRTDPRFYSLDVADHIVGSGGFQSRMVREIRSNRGLAYSVGSFYQAFPDFGVVGAFAQTKLESTLDVLGLMQNLLKEVAANGPDSMELVRAKEALINRHVFRYQDPASTVREQLHLFLDGLPPNLPALYPERVGVVSQEDVTKAAREIYVPDQGVTVIVGDVALDDPRWELGPPVTLLEVE